MMKVTAFWALLAFTTLQVVSWTDCACGLSCTHTVDPCRKCDGSPARLPDAPDPGC
ncbi:MAG: hypothetical protein HY716_06895 [Planctomycetes bacterium]|nr:hypothetical protein [Planctomycetota bacterium]